jgi:hypothetical protein
MALCRDRTFFSESIGRSFMNWRIPQKRSRCWSVTTSLCIVAYLWCAVFVASAHSDNPAEPNNPQASSLPGLSADHGRYQAPSSCLACQWDQAVAGAQVPTVPVCVCSYCLTGRIHLERPSYLRLILASPLSRGPPSA